MKILFATFWNGGMVANMRVKEYMLLGIVVDYSMHASTLTLFPHLHTHVHREWWWCWCLHHWHVSWDDMLQTSPVLARYCVFVTLLVALSHLNILNCSYTSFIWPSLMMCAHDLVLPPLNVQWNRHHSSWFWRQGGVGLWRCRQPLKENRWQWSWNSCGWLAWLWVGCIIAAHSLCSTHSNSTPLPPTLH